MKAGLRRLIGYILATGGNSIAEADLPGTLARLVKQYPPPADLVKRELRAAHKTAPRFPWLKVTEKGREAFNAAVAKKKAKPDPLEKLPTLELVTHLKRTPADWGRGFRILGKRWVGQFKSQADFDRQMRDAIAGTRQAAAGRGEARLEPVAIEAMEKGRPYLVTGGGGVWFSRGPIEHNETLKVYLVIVP